MSDVFPLSGISHIYTPTVVLRSVSNKLRKKRMVMRQNVIATPRVLSSCQFLYFFFFLCFCLSLFVCPYSLSSPFKGTTLVGQNIVLLYLFLCLHLFVQRTSIVQSFARRQRHGDQCRDEQADDIASSINTEIKVNGQKLMAVSSFEYLGSVITDEGSKPEMLSRIKQTTAALTRVKPVQNNRSISLSSKI